MCIRRMSKTEIKHINDKFMWTRESFVGETADIIPPLSNFSPKTLIDTLSGRLCDATNPNLMVICGRPFFIPSTQSIFRAYVFIVLVVGVHREQIQ